jgi:hypothetical protein
VSVKFGEYASPDFDSTVDTVVRARMGGVMSIEQSVEELYGDTWTREDKDAEIARLKAEQGILDVDEPAVSMDGIETEGGTDGNGSNSETGVPDDGQTGESAAGPGV